MKNIKAYMLHFAAVCFLLMMSYSPARAQSEICITQNLQAVLSNFINEVNTENNINEIHVNKLGPSTYQTVIYSGQSPMSNDGVPFISTNYEGVTFFLYSPLEHYFYPCNKEPLPNTDAVMGPPDGTFWIVTEKNGEMTVNKEQWVDPYNTLVPLNDEVSELDPDLHIQFSIDPILSPAPAPGFGTPPPPPAPAPAPGFGTPPPPPAPAPAPGFGTPPPPPAPAPAPGFGTPPPPAPDGQPQPVLGPGPEPAFGPGL